MVQYKKITFFYPVYKKKQKKTLKLVLFLPKSRKKGRGEIVFALGNL